MAQVASRAGFDTEGDGGSRQPAAIALVGELLARDIRQAIRGLSVRIEFTEQSGLVVARIESGCPGIVMLDMDLTPRPGEMLAFARSLRGDVRVVVVTYWWCDRPTPVSADAVLHKPVRRDEWFPAMARLELALR